MDCNGHLSTIDEVLLNSGPEAILRRGHGIKGRSKHRPKDVYHERNQGFAPIEVITWLPTDTSPTRLEVLDRATAQPRRELIFEEEGGKQHIIPIPHAIKTFEALNDHLRRYGVLGPTWPRIVVNCSADDAEFIALVEQRFGKIETIAEADRRPYPANVRAATLISLPPEYHRAIAKIGFHFFMWSFASLLTGFESCFDDIKRFIYGGGDPKRFVTSSVGNIDRDSTRLRTWTHVLAAGWSGRDMVATVQLFAGSDLGMHFIAGSEGKAKFGIDLNKQALIWFVRLGRTQLTYSFRNALVFVGYPEQRDGFDGEVQQLKPTREGFVLEGGGKITPS